LTTIGLDVGATTIKGAAVDQSGAVVSRHTVPTPSEGTSLEIENAIMACLDALRADAPTAVAVGLAAAGWIQADRRTVVFSANFPSWKDEPLVDRLEQRSGFPVILENDANAAAWGEFRFGAGAGTESMVAITLGSGVGGAVIVNGGLLRGFHGAAGEIGHSVMVTNGYPCNCGRRGCMENYVSGRSINRRAQPVVGDHDLHELARAGDARALSLYTELGGHLGRGLANVVMLVNPQRVVISGGVAAAFDLFADAAAEAMRLELGPSWSGLVPEFAVGTLGSDAGRLGAADLANPAQPT
jgi:glucokinase